MGGALVIAIGSLAIVILAPFAIGYGITIILWNLYDYIDERRFPEKYHTHKVDPITPEESERMSRQIEADRKRFEAKLESERLRCEEAREEERQRIEATKAAFQKERAKEEPEEEFTLNRNFYVERKLSHKEKEALFAQGYSRLKTSPYGDSGAAYYWVKTRYNESKEHAFFCYLIEKELRKYTSQVELFINSGPDVIARHAGNVYAFDVETGKNLERKPEDTRIKFEEYKRDYYRSHIFVTKKALKRKYQSMGLVITRSTFKKTISDIFY